MAPFHSFMISSLPFVFLLQLSLVFAAPWIVTADYEDDSWTYTERYGSSAYTTYTENLIEMITPTATSMPLALSTTTTTESYYGESVTIVEVLYPTGAGSPSDYEDGYGDDGDAIYNYYVNMVYTAPTGCSSHFTATTAVPIDVPYMIEGMVPVTTAMTTYSVDDSTPFSPTTYTEIMAFINPTQVPVSSLAAVSEQYAYSVYQDYGCSSYYDDGSDYGYGDSYYECTGNWFSDCWGVSPVGIIVVTVLSWFGFWLFVGMAESFFHFRRLCKGWQARRGFPLSWCMLFPILSCLFLFFSRRGFCARTIDDADELKKQWNEMGFWRKIGRWLRWGFIVKYPAFLGPAPPRVGQPNKRPIPLPTTPLLHVSSPPHSGVSSARPSVEPPIPEMSGVLPVHADTLQPPFPLRDTTPFSLARLSSLTK
ncbi:hypothetical protein ASPZODRAFT_144149 [Penicilliopsis zonata CBS 506.65]|uniref:Uncharacterized protein n=1 Tax=Penicilliopsis zonata CBS 506.65 TaxID=1073090 RepID=A0A1L9SE64_9EURO|nr:hypothetical protein ASPZODRAFT_144149 [Penicilliopsis zonata CBS 506.65]OJJ45520.1 hypothetical protein ASPZODRAFT_144149 [Penicilliopsis zonata CBS 506.65]